MFVNQRIGAILAAFALRTGITPNQLTLLGLMCALGTAPLIIVLHRQAVLAGIAAFVGWQLAYSLDCADGQLARATDRTSVFGAQLDLICDYIAHASVAITVLVLCESLLAGPIAGLAAGVLIVGLTGGVFYEALAGGTENTSSLKHSSVGVLLRQGGDYGLQTALLAIAIGTDRPKAIIAVATMIALYSITLVAYRVLHLASRTA